jgi:hypothetical protein
MFDTNCTWEIDWQKLDLSGGFWQMVIESGEEYNFAFQMPKRKGGPDITYIVPSSLQMGWKNSLAYFCIAMQTTRELIKWTYPNGNWKKEMPSGNPARYSSEY